MSVAEKVKAIVVDQKIAKVKDAIDYIEKHK